MAGEARRATVYRDHAGEWRYKVQGGNWRTIDAPEEGFKQKRSAIARVERRYPGIEIIVKDDTR